MDYYFEIKKPNDFRYNIMLCMKECLKVQDIKGKLELVHQAKKDLFEEANRLVKELEDLNVRLESLLVDDELKKEIQQEVEKEKTQRAEQERIAEERIRKERREEAQEDDLPVFSDLKNQEKDFASNESEDEKEGDARKVFDYTLEQIDKKLAELRQD